MNKFSIGDWYPKNSKNADYLKLVDEIKDKLGIDHLGGDPPYRILEKDGYYFISRYWSYKNEWDVFYRAVYGLPNHPDGEVICDCGNMTFHITYGSYECFGTCTSCGKTDSLYSG